MKLFVGADHAGFDLKEYLKKQFSSRVEMIDLGTHSTDSADYPDFARMVAEAVLSNENSLGLLICGTGIGMSIAANKIKGIRAACVSEEKSARLAREHNNAQILCLGARIVSEEKAALCLESFLNADFESEHPRHLRRIQKLHNFEKL